MALSNSNFSGSGMSATPALKIKLIWCKVFSGVIAFKAFGAGGRSNSRVAGIGFGMSFSMDSTASLERNLSAAKTAFMIASL